MHRKYGLVILAILLVLPAAALRAKQTKDPLVELGRFIFEDMALSFNHNQSCKVCHFPSAGTEDKDNSTEGSPVSAGSVDGRSGGRNAPSAAYAAFSPVFHLEEDTYVGGLFWDGRATGTEPTVTGGLGAGPTFDPLSDQAKGPFLNPVEMALDEGTILAYEPGAMLYNEALVVDILVRSDYANLFLEQYEIRWGESYFSDPAAVGRSYNLAAEAIAAFERSVYIVLFNSKFDRFVAEQRKIDPGFDPSLFGVQLVDCVNAIREDGQCQMYEGPPADFRSKVFTYEEAVGLALFNADSYVQLGNEIPEGFTANGGMCYACHPTAGHEVLEDGDHNPPNVAPGTYPPVFTDFTYDNLGIPVNPAISDLLGGTQPVDYGLGKVGENPLIDGSDPYCPDVALPKYDPESGDMCPGQNAVAVNAGLIGLFKVPTLRNVARSAPYGHNGFFATLTEIVQFYNARDVEDLESAEVPFNVNGDELGNLGLDDDQIAKLVKFMETLSDEFD